MTPLGDEGHPAKPRLHRLADGELEITAPAGLDFSNLEHHPGGAAVLAEPDDAADALEQMEGDAWVVDLDTDIARARAEFELRLPTAEAGEGVIAIAVDDEGNPYLAALPTVATADGAEISVRLGGDDEEQEEVSTMVSPGRVAKLWVKKVLNVGDERKLGLFEIEPGAEGFDYRKVDGPLAGGGRTALVVHGALSELKAMEDLPSFLLGKNSPRKYDRILGFEFETVATGIATNGKGLVDSLALAGLPQDGSLDVFAYSMGTLVTRSCLELHGGSVFTRRVILVAPPNAGTPLALDQDRLLKWGSMLLGAAGGKIGAVVSLLFKAVRGNNEGLDDLAPGSPFLQKLAAGGGPATKYMAIPGVSQDSTFLRRVLGKVANSYYGESNDWVVPLSSTSANVVGDEEQIESNHFNFFDNECEPIEGPLWGWLT